MANMSYCRFENTLSDLQDCHQALWYLLDGESPLSDSEERAAAKLVDLCADIVTMLLERVPSDAMEDAADVVDGLLRCPEELRKVLLAANSDAKQTEVEE